MSIYPGQDLIATYLQVNNAPASFKPVRIVDFTPSITQQDINDGEITRYFCRPVHQSATAEIQEIDITTYNTLVSNRFYTTVTLRWTIKGQLDDKFGLTADGSQVRLYTGVITANSMSVQLLNEQMPGISNAITNYQKFYQGV